MNNKKPEKYYDYDYAYLNLHVIDHLSYPSRLASYTHTYIHTHVQLAEWILRLLHKEAVI